MTVTDPAGQAPHRRRRLEQHFRLLAQAHLDQRLLHVQARIARQGRLTFNLVLGSRRACCIDQWHLHDTCSGKTYGNCCADANLALQVEIAPVQFDQGLGQRR